MPFTYLGLPLGTTKPSVEDHAPIVTKIERRLSAASIYLALAGRVTYINSAIRSIPIYAMCTLNLHATVTDHIDKLSRPALWRGREMEARGRALVAWNQCTIPNEKGGLGIKNIRLQNEALLIKHLDKFYNRKDVPWVNLVWHRYYPNGQIPHETAVRCSFWWRHIMSFSDHFSGIANCSVGDGNTVMLWHDIWNNHNLQNQLPRLYSHAKNVKVSVAQYMVNNAIEDNFHLPMTPEAFNELHELNNIITELNQNQDRQRDEWHYIWGSRAYSTSKFYMIPFLAIQPPQPIRWIWKSKCSKKIKIFTWLLFLDRLNVRVFWPMC